MMITDILIIVFTGLFLLMPLIVWLYLYENFSREFVARRYVLFGMFLGSLITLPIIMSAQASVFGVFEYIFGHLYMGQTFMLIVWFLGLIFSLYILFFLILSLFKKTLSGLGFLLFSIVILSGVSIFCIILYMLGAELGVGSHIFLSEPRMIYGIIFSTFTSMAGYYLIVSLLEESGKFVGHLSQAHKKHYTVSLSHFLTFGVSVAVGFSFFENIIYSYMSYAGDGLGLHLVVLAFFRGIISLSLHVLCTLLFSLGMWQIWNVWDRGNKEYLRYVLYTTPIFASLLFHTFFNVSLTFGYVGVSFLVFLGLYFVVAYIVPVTHRKNAV